MSVVLGYLVNHILSTKFLIAIALLSSYCIISNYHVTESIMVTPFKSKISFFAFILMMQESI